VDIDQIKQILERYKQGKCSVEEREVIEQWFDSINRNANAIIEDDFLQEQLDEVQGRLQEQIHPRQLKSIRPSRWRWLSVAAVLIFSLGVIYFLYTNKASTHQSLADAGHPKLNKVVKDGFVEITTARGASERIVLSDGSTISLNASSKLRYPVDFGPSARNIFLDEGEAFFKVATDQKRPFTVFSGELSTTALGTSFNIRAYPHEHKITVALLTGKVKVDQKNVQQENAGQVILLPSELLSFDRNSLQMVKSNFSQPDEIVGWKHGYLVFKDASLGEIITEIENRYDVKVINESGKEDWSYTGSFKDESLQDVIETICLTKNIDYMIKNDTIILTSKN